MDALRDEFMDKLKGQEDYDFEIEYEPSSLAKSMAEVDSYEAEPAPRKTNCSHRRLLPSLKMFGSSCAEPIHSSKPAGELQEKHC